MSSLLIIRGPDITAEVVNKISDSMKAYDVGGSVVVGCRDYYWELYEDAMVKEGSS